MKMLDHLPHDWREQIYEARNDFIVQTALAPDTLTIPWFWMRCHAKIMSEQDRTRDKYHFLPYGDNVLFGFVSGPVFSIHISELQKQFAIPINHLVVCKEGDKNV